MQTRHSGERIMQPYLRPISPAKSGAPALTTLTFFLTPRIYPYGNMARSGNANIVSFLPIESLQRAVYEALPLGLQTVRLCGEVSLYPPADAVFDLIDVLGLSLMLEIQGGGITQQYMQRIARLPHCHVSVWCQPSQSADPCDSPDSAAALHTVRLLAENGIHAQMVREINRATLQRLPTILQNAEEAGAGSLRLTFFHPLKGTTGQIPPFSEKEKHDRIQIEELIALGQRLGRGTVYATRLSVQMDQPPVFRGLNPKASIAEPWRWNVIHHFGVLTNGEFTIDMHPLPGLSFGSVGNQPLESIWRDHPILQTLREGLPDRLEGVCQHCIMKKTCLGYNPAENYRYTGSFWEPYWFCAAAQKAGLFPTGRLIENHW